MKRIIEGRVYNTATAARICEVPCETYDRGNWHWHDTSLYKSPRGAYFIAGEGGPLSMWAEVMGTARRSGSGLRVITEEEARAFAEAADLCAEEYEETFGPCAIG